jgi:putative tryptophan/tyrosine transport system substrate-binding protein
MRRREFITLLGGAVATWPLAARAQQPERMRRVGVLMAGPNSDSERQSYVAAFREGLAKLGWTAGRNLQIDYAWDANSPEMARAAAAEMILRLAPDVILATSTPVLSGARQANGMIPIVFTAVSEPVAQGFVASLARPGGNITGFTNLEPPLGAKWLELLKEIFPHLTRVTTMFNPQATPISEAFARSVANAAPKFAVQAITATLHDAAEIEAAMMMLDREPGGGLILPPDVFTNTHRKLIIDLAARYRIPVIGWTRSFAAEGGLISYGADIPDMFRRAANYVDRILRGEKPADLPIQQPTKFELVINLKTAKALGLAVPPTLLARANEVIE